MKTLLSLLFLSCFSASAANIDYRALLTNFFTTNNLYVGLNTNSNSGFSNAVVNIINSNVTVTVFGYQTNAITTNSPAGMTNVVQDLATNAALNTFTNQIPNFINGHTNQVAKFTPNTNTVGDSIISNPATNLITIASRLDPNKWTNDITLQILGEYTNPTNYEGLEIIGASAHGSTFNVIRAAQPGSAGTLSAEPLRVMDAWQFNSATNTPGGNTAGALFPITDNLFPLGSTVNRVLHGFAGPAGWTCTDAPNVNAASCNFSADTYGINMWASGIWMEKKSSGFLSAFASDGIGSGTYIGPNLFGAGSSTTTLTWDTFMTRGNEAHTWDIQTNNTGATFPPNAVLGGSTASGTDKSGGALELIGGRSTGVGTNGPVIISTALQSDTTSSSLNTRQIREYICADRIKLTTNSATLVMNFTLPTALKSVGVRVFATTTIENGVDIATVSESFIVAAVRKATTVTTAISAPTPTVSLATGAASLTTTWTAVANAQSVDLKCNAVTAGITSTNSSTMFRAEFDSGSPPVIVQAQ